MKIRFSPIWGLAISIVIFASCAKKPLPLTEFEELEEVTLNYYRALFRYKKAMDKLEADADSIKTIPDFRFVNLDGTPYTRALLVGKPVWLMFFSSGCSHCQEELEQMRQHIDKFDDAQLVLVSEESVDSLVAFRNREGWDAYSQVRVVRDQTQEGFYKFKVTGTPTSFVFDGKGRKLFNSKGGVSDSTVNEVVSYIKK